MVLLVFPVKCKTMTETKIKISKDLCVGCSVVCSSVCMVCRVADHLCSSSSKAIWALFTAELTHCNCLLVLCDFEEIPLAVALGGKFPGITPASCTHLGQKPTQPQSWATGGCVHQCVITDGPGLEHCPPLSLRNFERQTLPEGTKLICCLHFGKPGE